MKHDMKKYNVIWEYINHLWGIYRAGYKKSPARLGRGNFLLRRAEPAHHHAVRIIMLY